MARSDTVLREQTSAVGPHPGGLKATPAVRALAHRLDVDLAIVTPSGPDGTITTADVQRGGQDPGRSGTSEPLRGVRRAMARTLASAHAEVVPVTICEDADIHAWPPGSDVTLRLIRALVAACQSEPALNAWYDSHAVGRRLLKKIEPGSPWTPRRVSSCRYCGCRAIRTPDDLRRGLNAMREAVRKRTIPPEELRGYTITLSNFGTFGGRYANPIIVPPTVAILGAGRIRPTVVACHGQRLSIPLFRCP